MYERILVSSDGSATAQAGVDHGLELARKHGSKVTAVTVTEPLGGQFAFAFDLWSPSEAEIEAFDTSQALIAQRILGPIREKAEALGVPIETIHVPRRLVAGALLEIAEKKGCTLIVMSSHGHTGLSRVMLGSQAAEVAENAKVPVLIVR
ncbi:universal stress protein [Shinella pollutisoli]|uniref:Universal stress protein n=1 Tax=Shinella pollutisoli TaxID=2250594 RepID=A0ABV7DE04_9HYPH|nr:universal stress protein [Shinella pollutisoli]